MDGRNSTGRKVSLLNDNHSHAVATVRLPPLSLHFAHSHSRSPSCASSTPSLSPQTPQLVRTDSSDSRTLPPSPLTPHFTAFESAIHHKHISSQNLYLIRPSHYAKMDDQTASMYPPLPEASGVMPYPMPSNTTNQQRVFRASDSPASEPSHLSNASAASGKPAPKKNQYPCPLAKQVGCNDFFTTSGHAARHAKKHTGKKDAFCPECNKAFTRKDNMEQHRRTHQTVRGPAKTTGDNRVKKATKPSTRKSDKPVPAPLEAAVNAQLDEQQQHLHQQHQHQQQQQAQVQLMQQPILAAGPGPGPYFLNSEPIQALPQPVPTDFNGRPPLYRNNFTNSLDFVPPPAAMMSDPNDLHYSYPSPGLSNGLDTLALAASDYTRLSTEDSS